MRETYFITPEALYKELKHYLKNKDFLYKDFKYVEEPEDIYLFQPAFIEALEMFLFEHSKDELKKVIPHIKEYVSKAPYKVEGRNELIWALELWKESINVSFTKMLNVSKARKNKVHSVIK